MTISTHTVICTCLYIEVNLNALLSEFAAELTIIELGKKNWFLFVVNEKLLTQHISGPVT